MKSTGRQTGVYSDHKLFRQRDRTVIIHSLLQTDAVSHVAAPLRMEVMYKELQGKPYKKELYEVTHVKKCQ